MSSTRHSNPLTFCISTHNNLNYLRIAVDSVRKNSYFKYAPFIIHAENCSDGTNEWLEENKELYNLTTIIESDNKVVRGIGGGMNICADNVQTEYIMFLHSDFYVTKNWDKALYDITLKYPEEKLWINSYRIEPDQFNSSPRAGTTLVPMDMFGGYYYNFNREEFDKWAEEFIALNKGYQVPKGEGVSGLVKKELWDKVGGNDPIFAPASWEDMDLFLRMLMEGVRFILPIESVVWHFGARGSHRLEENEGRSSDRQMLSEQKNIHLWIQKWGKSPSFDRYGMIEVMV